MSRTEKDGKDVKIKRRGAADQRRPPAREKGGHVNLVREASTEDDDS